MSAEVKIFKNGQEVSIEDLDKAFTTEFLHNNPFGRLLVGVLELAQVGLQGVSEPEEEMKKVFEEDSPILFEEPTKDSEIPVCSGDPDNCPVCGESLLISFADALEAMKNGEKVTRKKWLNLGYDVDYISLIPGFLSAETFFAIVDSKGKISPYVFDSLDLLAEDWVILVD